jgi:hypothetical protein
LNPSSCAWFIYAPVDGICFLFIFYGYPTVPPKVKLLYTPGPTPAIGVRIISARPLHVSVDPVAEATVIKGATGKAGEGV